MHPTPDQLALLALGENDSPSAQEHVRTCPACRTDVEGWARVVTIGRSITPDDVLFEPDMRVWQSIGREIRTDGHSAVTTLPTASAAVPGVSVSDSSQPPRRRWPALALAAALALILGVGLGFGVSRGLADKTDVAGVTTLNALPSWKGSNGTATVEKDDAGNRTLVITAKIPDTTAVDGTMEVWLGDSYAEDMVPMGTMSGPIGRFPVPKDMDLKAHPIVDVSLEPPGDTNPAHSDNSMLRGRLAL